jgi:hypothetical protein
LSPTNLFTYIFELKVNFSPIYLLTYKFKMCYSHPRPPACLTTNLPTKPHLHGYTYLHGCHCNKPPMIDNNEERIKWRCYMEFVLIHSNKINKEMIKVFNTPYIRVLQVLFK